MMRTRTTSTGTTIAVQEQDDVGLVIICDHPDAPDDMRHQEVGRIIGGGFQPAFISAWALTPETLRAIADLVEEASS